MKPYTVSGEAAPTVESRGTARRDLGWIVLLTALTAVVCVKFEVSEALVSWSRALERFQVDELPLVLLALAVCLIWFSARRYREARHEVERRRRAEARLSEALAESRRLSQQHVEIQEAERKALAHDLHDELGQYLNAVKLDAVALREGCEDAASRETATVMIKNIDHVQGAVLGLLRQLRPVGLDELGLGAAIEHCLNEWKRRLPDLRIEAAIENNVDEIDEMRRLALYRLVQEALTNVARHSNATWVRIAVSCSGDAPQGIVPKEIVAEIWDNGSGADLATLRVGLGLLGMRERAAAFGGSLTIASVPNEGFQLTARIPLGAWKESSSS